MSVLELWASSPIRMQKQGPRGKTNFPSKLLLSIFDPFSLAVRIDSFRRHTLI